MGATLPRTLALAMIEGEARGQTECGAKFDFKEKGGSVPRGQSGRGGGLNASTEIKLWAGNFFLFLFQQLFSFFSFPFFFYSSSCFYFFLFLFLIFLPEAFFFFFLVFFPSFFLPAAFFCPFSQQHNCQ